MDYQIGEKRGMHRKVNYKTRLVRDAALNCRRLDKSFVTLNTVPDKINAGQFSLCDDLSAMNYVILDHS